MKLFPATGVFAPIYLLCVLLLVLFAGCVIGLVEWGIGPMLRQDEEGRLRWIAAQLLALRDTEGPFTAALTDAGRELRRALTLYDAHGQVVASNVTPALPFLSPDEQRRLASTPLLWLTEDRLAYVMQRPPQAALYLISEEIPTYTLFIGPGILFGSLGVLVLVCAPIVHWISRPLSQLAETVQRFGRGDLGVRASVRGQYETRLLAQAFNAMAARVEQSLRMEKELLALVAHELRTPLARLRVALEMVEDETAPPPDVFQGMNADVMELQTLLEDVLLASRLALTQGALLANGAPLLRRQHFPLTALLDRCIQGFRALHPERTLLVDMPILPTVEGDARLLRRALDNLLENAHRYSPPHAAITIRCRVTPQSLCFEVQDGGHGVRPEELVHLGTPFFQPASASPRRGGLGLGLLLVKRVTEAHGGDFVVESTPEAGTTVRLTMPRTVLSPHVDSTASV